MFWIMNMHSIQVVDCIASLLLKLHMVVLLFTQFLSIEFSLPPPPPPPTCQIGEQ